MDVNVDWAGRLPGSVLLDIATYHLSLSDIKCASQVCQRWNSVLSLCCRRVVLKPFRSDARRGSRPTAAERYPTHLFCRRDTVCLLPLSKCRISAMDAHDLEIFASVLSDYRLPLLNVHYSVDEVAALRTRAEGAQRALEAARRARQAAVNRAHSRTAPAVLDPHPQQPYYALSVPLVTTLTSLLRSPRQPGRNLRRLVLRLTALPEPRALFSLALLPSLESLELIGGPAAFLEHSHLEALDALRGLKELTVEGVWDEVRRQYSDRGDLVQGGGGGGGGAGPAAAPWIHLDAMNPWEQGLANLQGADVGVEMEMQQPAPAAALQAHFWAAAGGLGGNGEAPWPEFFTSLEHLRVLRLRAINASDTAMAAAAAGFRRPTPLRLDLYLLTGLQALSVVGWQLDPGLSRMGQLQRLTHLQTDRVLSVAEWTVVRGLEGLAEAVLRAEVAGYMGQPKLIGGSVFLHYGNDQRSDNHGQLDFPLPPELRGDRSKAGGAAAATSGGTVSGGGASAAVGNLFLAGAGGMEEQRCSSSFRQRIKDLAEAHVQLEPLR
ncbi:hypothetical protein Vretifemale_2972 [Volvox reticuliferus]|nr:hypothetical protein Vretifemale_2972 [Volvox reticuliferus]